MIERICQLAEQSAISASRRQFLGQAANLAGGLALAFAALCLPKEAQAGKNKRTCVYACVDDTTVSKTVNCESSCPDKLSNGKHRVCNLWFESGC